MLIPDAELRLELKFLKQPPSTVSASDPFTVICHFEAFSRSSDNSSWIPPPEDSLQFKAEFVSTGAGPSARSAVFPFPSNDVTIDVSSDDVLFLITDIIEFRPSAVPVPGTYQIQVSGYRVHGLRRSHEPLAQVLSDYFDVTSSSPPRHPRRTGPSSRPPPTLRRSS
jgi:hypothetical protein